MVALGSTVGGWRRRVGSERHTVRVPGTAALPHRLAVQVGGYGQLLLSDEGEEVQLASRESHRRV